MSHIFLPFIALPTRIQGLSHTLIDNIFYKSLASNTVVILSNHISYHQMIFFCTKLQLVKNKVTKFIEIERYSDERGDLMQHEFVKFYTCTYHVYILLRCYYYIPSFSITYIFSHTVCTILLD